MLSAHGDLRPHALHRNYMYDFRDSYLRKNRYGGPRKGTWEL